jgi:hypothetical protein
LVVVDDNTVIEDITITTTGHAPAIWVYGAKNVTLRNIKIVHEGADRVQGTIKVDDSGTVTLGDSDLAGETSQLAAAEGVWADLSGAGIFFQNAPNIRIENVHVSLVRPADDQGLFNKFATGGVCDTQYCGPFTREMWQAYNIYGQDSDSPSLENVYVTGGSTGFWCKNCPHGTVSHFKAENLHGPFARGQCFQVVSSTNFLLEDFTCVQDNEVAFPEDDVSVWDSPYSTVQRGLIQGGNAPNGVGIIMEMSDHCVVTDVDVTLVGGTSFSAYGSDNVTFWRTRARDNHGEDGSCAAGHGFCQDPNGLYPNSEIYVGDQTVEDKTCCESDGILKRCDTQGGIWYAGDYSADQIGTASAHAGYVANNIAIKEGKFYNMVNIESGQYTNTGACISIDMDYWATSAATRQEAYILKDFSMEDFTLRTPFVPSFCFAV